MYDIRTRGGAPSRVRGEMASRNEDELAAPESPKERVDRELGELLQEIRVVLPGIQVLLAFLLTVPFAQRADALEGPERRIYFLAVVSSAIAVACLLAPAAHHRLLFRSKAKVLVLHVANALVIVGTLLVAISVGLVVYLVGWIMIDQRFGAAIAAGLTTATLLLWFAVPLVIRGADRRPEQ